MENSHLIQGILDLLTLLIFTAQSSDKINSNICYSHLSLSVHSDNFSADFMCFQVITLILSTKLPSTAKSDPTVIFFQLSQTITRNKSADAGSLYLEAPFLLCISEIMSNAGYKQRVLISLEATLPPISVTLIHLTFLRVFAPVLFSFINFISFY